MRIEPIEIKDKFDRNVIFRNAEKTDAINLINYLKITTCETPYLVREPDEVQLTVEQEIEFIENINNSKRELMLIAILNGKHIGNCSLMSLSPYKRYSHRCGIGIALYQEFCNCGIGKEMLKVVLDIAKKIGYEQAELEVMSDNKIAIEMYKKLGFKIYGHFPENMKYYDGRYADAEWMMKKL